MANELTDFEHRQLTSHGPCNLHTHETVIDQHKHLDSLQSLEVVVSVNGDYTARYLDDIIMGDTTSANVTITLPPSRGGKKFYILKTVAANTLHVQFSNSETMLGATTHDMTALGEGKWFKGVPEGYIPL